ncbi:MAG TPA: Lrp/AsnC family transcriptional regulator [Candidatus Nanoarchaeia archaeon]|nr:Lrp/AsnC family transcriptional regulator [Candidatus Nanoarchaeia archaeon]
MDKIDQKLLTELDKDPKIPLTQLAKKLLISQQVADYRMKRLIKQGVIVKFAAIINLKSLRQEHYRIFFRFNAKFDINEVFSYLKNQKEVYWTARIGGRYDLLLTLFVFDFAAFDQFIGRFNQEFPGLIRDITSCYVLNHCFYNHKFLSKEFIQIEYGYNDPSIELDELDQYILRKIKDNCRVAALELARERGTTYKTILNRIKALEKNKVILGYRLFIKSKDHLPFIVLFSFKEYATNKEKELINYLARKEEVTQSLRIFGVWNLLIHVRMGDNEKLQRFIAEVREKFDIISDYEIIPIFEDIAINLMPI